MFTALAIGLLALIFWLGAKVDPRTGHIIARAEMALLVLFGIALLLGVLIDVVIFREEIRGFIGR